MTEKDELYEEAENQFGVKLDRRMKLSDLQDQMTRLRENKKNPPPEKKVRLPLTVRNVVTGNEFPYTDAFKGLPDLEVIEWQDAEDDDGDD
tara:strand:- start:19 stop:291 length:273 start_codon:yes stop_codon:yes gene_type:complete